MAAVSPPANETATYTANDQIAKWNGASVTYDANTSDNVKYDPSTNLTYTWDARNQLTGISGGISETYDAFGRRETSVNGQTLSLLHDGPSLTAWQSQSSGSWSFLTAPGGGALAGTLSLSGSNTYVPLMDISGSIVALANTSQSGSPITTGFSYDPSGMPTVSGASTSWPFMWHGLEHEITDPAHLYFEPSGNVYNPDPFQLSPAGPQGLDSAGAGPRSIGGPGGGAGAGVPLSIQNDLNESGANAFALLYTAEPINPDAVPVAVALQIFAQFFPDFFGGSDNPTLPRQELHGVHYIYPVTGISSDLTVDQGPSANPGRPLSDCEKGALVPYIPQVDLDDARVHTNGVPWFTPSNKGGIILYNDIYFRAGQYDASKPEGLGLLGHELVHVGQYRNGMTPLSYLWAAAGQGYAGNQYEVPAYALEARIATDLSRKGTGCCCQ